MTWADRQSPSLADLEEMAGQAFQRLPAFVHEHCADLVIRVDDLPDEQVCEDLGLESPFDLLGLYHGVSLIEKSSFDAVPQPDMVFLYRLPLLAFWAEGEEPLGRVVTHVLVHEIGHHFGFSDADMEAIEAAMA